MSTRRVPVGNGVEALVYAQPPPSTAPALWPIVGEYRVYDDVLYYLMTHDQVRVQGYQHAIASQARGKVALDIGTGSDVNWARACVEAGATRVYAIEELDATFELAAKTLAKHGLEDKIRLIRGSSTRVELPEKVDLCVSEIIGSIGGSEGVAVVLDDARRRFLKPGGAMIPSRCETRVAGVELPTTLHDTPAFGRSQAGYVKKIFTNVGHPLDVKLGIAQLPASAILSTDGVFEDLGFDVDPVVTSASRSVSLRITRPGRLDGLILWIRLRCAPDLAPIDSLAQATSWTPVFFPLFHPGVSVRTDDELTFTCDVRPSDDGVLPDYRVEGELRTGGTTKPFRFEALHHGAVFRQNGYYARLFPPPM